MNPTMSTTTTVAMVVVALSWLMLNDNNHNVAATRDIQIPAASPRNDINNILIITAERLETSGGGLVECWTALLELKSCSNEIVLFFLNGEAHIGPACCQAVVFIARNCWPAMLTSLGFTVQEGDILQGYCDAVAAAAPPLPISPSPVAQPQAIVLN